MSLLRAAFERDDGVVYMVVLCTGCLTEFLTKVGTARRWTKPIDIGVCEFCEAEIRSAALNG